MSPTLYHVVIMQPDGGIMSRHAGTDLAAATQTAIGRRSDFPNAKEVRVVCSTGVIATY